MQNYYLCGDLVKLFALCPMNADRLSENPTVNQVPYLIATDEKIREITFGQKIREKVGNKSAKFKTNPGNHSVVSHTHTVIRIVAILVPVLHHLILLSHYVPT